MPDHKDLKRLIRARMRKTGESYTAARAHVIRQGSGPPGGERAPRPDEFRDFVVETSIRLGSPLGGTAGPRSDREALEPIPADPGMNPFERFSENAKRVLTLAQQEAEKARHSYIGTEHLLLGLIRHVNGLAAIILAVEGVTERSVRETVERALGRNLGIIVTPVLPTSRVKKVIELAFGEARHMADSHVGTEHLLLALLLEGEGIAAHVLRVEAGRQGSRVVRPEHLLVALAGLDVGPVGAILGSANLTPARIRQLVAEGHGPGTVPGAG